jgi:TIR domain
MKVGDRIRTRIDEVIRLHEKLLLVLSANSIDSDWVEKEVETALEKERVTKSTVLFPVRLDDAVMDSETGWAADIRRSRHIGDFRGWKDHDGYRKAFERLLRDLKVELTT